MLQSSFRLHPSAFGGSDEPPNARKFLKLDHSLRRTGLHFGCEWSRLWGVVCVSTLAVAGGPAFSQAAADSFTVLGANPHADEASAGISYADLDLTTHRGRAALYRRVERTAVVLCRRLGADHVGGNPVELSCADRAIMGALKQERELIAAANAPNRTASSSATTFVMTVNGEEDR